MQAKHISHARAVFESNDQTTWVCAVRTVSLNTLCVVYSACLSGLSCLTKTEKSAGRLFLELYSLRDFGRFIVIAVLKVLLVLFCFVFRPCSSL